MDIARFTEARCPELARFLAACVAQPLSFAGEDPNLHSAWNHVHLWALEWWAERVDWIDTDYRTDFAAHVLARWRERLRGLPPYRGRGYRMYLYEDLAPTLSVVAETDAGFPYPGAPVFVATLREVMAPYAGRRWSGHFAPAPWTVSRDALLAAVEARAGSISRPTAAALGLRVGALRRLIEEMGLDREVNAIRKRHRRRPARFRPDRDPPHVYRIHERRLPPGY